jgi:uncharacterized protein (TIRG00374 family)
MLSYKRQARGRRGLRALLSPKAIISAVIGLIVLALLLGFSDAREVFRIMRGFPPLLIPVIFALFVGREVFRFLQWGLFLNAIGIKATRKQAFLTLMGGDAAQVVPGGLYFQDVLAMREFDVSFSQVLGATLLIIWLETMVCFFALAILGLPGTPLLSPIMAVCGVGSLVAMLGLRSRVPERLQGWLHRREEAARQRWQGYPGQLICKLLGGIDEVVGSLRSLARPWVLFVGLVLSVAYITLTIFGFYLICVGLGLSATISPGDVAAIYSLTLVAVVINPSPIDIGVAELAGVGSFLLFGAPAAAGLAAMLTLRVLMTMTEEVMAALAFLFSRKEVQRLFRSQKVEASD